MSKIEENRERERERERERRRRSLVERRRSTVRGTGQNN